jgi:hypothetical protein
MGRGKPLSQFSKPQLIGLVVIGTIVALIFLFGVCFKVGSTLPEKLFGAVFVLFSVVTVIRGIREFVSRNGSGNA